MTPRPRRTLAARFDVALGRTARLAFPVRKNATGQRVIALERGVRGKGVRCEASVDRAARNILFSSAKIFDEHDTVCARATAVLSLGAELTSDEWGDLLEHSMGKTS